MKSATRFLFDLDKVTLETFTALVKEIKNSWGITIRVVDQGGELVPAFGYSDEMQLKPDQLIELHIASTCRVGKEVWHRGDVIKRPVSDFIDIITRHVYE